MRLRRRTTAPALTAVLYTPDNRWKWTTSLKPINGIYAAFNALLRRVKTI